jgi:NodT family efflux transporter outer membrane factor (OMF) lipoprotein
LVFVSMAVFLEPFAWAAQPGPLRRVEQDVKHKLGQALQPVASPTPDEALAGWRQLPVLKATLSQHVALASLFPEALWWQQFQDPHLNGYIEKALKQSPSLDIALQRIQQARAVAFGNLSDELPRLELTPTITRQQFSANLTAPSLNQVGTQQNAAFSPGRRLTLYIAPFTANYELDLFLKKRDKTRASQWRTRATEADFRAARLALVAEVAATYVQLLLADAHLQVDENYLAVLAKQIAHAGHRVRLGADTPDAGDALQQQWQSAQMARQADMLVRDSLEHQLAFLLGDTPARASQLARGSLQTLAYPQQLALGNPQALLVSRPDLQAAAARLKAVRYEVRWAKKELLPTLPLAATFGFASTQWRNWLSADSWLWALSAGATQKIFRGGGDWAQIRYWNTAYQIQLHELQQIYLAAAREVEDSLAALANDDRQLLQLRQQATHQVAQLRRQQARVRLGLETPVSLAPLQIAHLQNQRAQRSTQARGFLDVVNLYKALGGGAIETTAQ